MSHNFLAGVGRYLFFALNGQMHNHIHPIHKQFIVYQMFQT